MCITLSLVGMDIHEQHVGEREGAEELDITSSLLRMDMHERPYMSSTYVSKCASLFPLRRAREGRRGVRGMVDKWWLEMYSCMDMRQAMFHVSW